VIELLLDALICGGSILLSTHPGNKFFDLGQFLWITLLLVKVSQIFGKRQKVVFDSLGGNDISTFDQLQGINVDVYLTLVDTEPVAMEAL
jgi:hypothetical protein